MHSNTPRIAQNNANTPKEKSKEAPVLKRPPKPYKYPWGFRAERRGQVPGWLHELSKRINAALRHSVGCRQDKKTFSGMPCDEGAWVNIENFMKYDHLWKNSYVLDGTDTADWRKVIERWNPFIQVICTEFRNLHRARAQILELKATSGELRQVVRVDPRHRILSTINRNKLRIEIGDDDDEVWLWPVAIRAPMGHSKLPGGAQIEAWRLSHRINPGVGHVLGGRFHGTHINSLAGMFQEGLRPGGGRQNQHFSDTFLLLGTVDPRALSNSTQYTST